MLLKIAYVVNVQILTRILKNFIKRKILKIKQKKLLKKEENTAEEKKEQKQLFNPDLKLEDIYTEEKIKELIDNKDDPKAVLAYVMKELINYKKLNQ